uniref:Uncharacterized protein n=1 Tax=Clytia hemisphaerica TaxID=252671 RepID=A0A7M5XGC2_9CNID
MNIENLHLRDFMDKYGRTNFMLSWTKIDKFHDENQLYGFKLTINLDGHGFSFSMYTKYGFNKQMKIKKSTKPMRGHVTPITNYSVPLTVFGSFWINHKRQIRGHTTSYKMNIDFQALPNSNELNAIVNFRSREVLCDEYAESHNGSYPTSCYPFKNLRITGMCRRYNFTTIGLFDYIYTNKSNLYLHWEANRNVTLVGKADSGQMNMTHFRLKTETWIKHILPWRQGKFKLIPRKDIGGEPPFGYIEV